MKKKNSHDHAVLRAEFKAREEERLRISQDIHDSIGQDLSVLKMYTSTLKSMKMSEDCLKLLHELETLATDLIHAIRRVSYDLSPSLILNNPLHESLGVLVRKNGISNEIIINYSSHGEVAFSSKEKETHLYRVVQEFINNSLKYSEAGSIDIKLFKEKGRVKLHLSDNGIGFVSSKEVSSLGLVNIKNRLELIDAEYSFTSENGIGTNLNISINEKSHKNFGSR